MTFNIVIEPFGDMAIPLMIKIDLQLQSFKEAKINLVSEVSLKKIQFISKANNGYLLNRKLIFYSLIGTNMQLSTQTQTPSSECLHLTLN